MLLQLDGSRHAWLEERGPWLTLLAAIDDATGTIPAAVFRTQEDAAGYLALVHQMVCTVGVPEAVYHDRHGIFLRPSRAPESLAEQVAGEREPTQVGRALRDFGIVSIAAHSPQAKGRIERLFGTLQDRLVAELRLAGATTQEEANTVLTTAPSRFNARFAVPAASSDSAWRSLDPALDPWQICCFRYTRTVGRDDTVRLGAHRLQLLPPRDHGTYARCRVEIHEHLDGSLSVWHQGQVIASRPAPAEAPVLRARHGRSTTPLASDASLARGVVTGGSAAGSSPAPPAERRSPSPTHPWRSGLHEARVTQSQISSRDRVTDRQHTYHSRIAYLAALVALSATGSRIGPVGERRSPNLEPAGRRNTPPFLLEGVSEMSGVFGRFVPD